jgi:quercetin dioxygenase-like cupin family protein
MTIDKQQTSKFLLQGLADYVEGGVVSKSLLKKQGGNISLFAFDKGEGLSEHTAPFDAVVLIVDGTAEIKIGQEIYSLAAGEGIVIPAGAPHQLRAVERFKMALIMIKSN